MSVTKISLALLIGSCTSLTGSVVPLLGEGGMDDASWLAQLLARTDPDVDAAIDAYTAGDLDSALEHIDLAIARRGERPELLYDRGLILVAQGDREGAKSAFERGTESDVLAVRASSSYELGNLAMAAEDWEGAIQRYIECLRVAPDHENAKWNLELALQRKREQEKKEQEKQEQENQDQQNQDQQNQDQQNQDQQNQDQQNQDQQNQDQQGEQQGEQQPDQQGEQQGEQAQDQQQPGEQEQGKQDQQQQGEQGQQEPSPSEQQQAAPIESGDLDAALDQLDQRDSFMFGRPSGRQRPVEKDW